MQANKTAIKLKGITKIFGSVKANDEIDFDIKYGEILALLGENGSGKTTLMNMLSGIYQPDSGEIYKDDELISINSPKDSFAYGIGMIHQHFKLVDVLSAAENVAIGTKNKIFERKSSLSAHIKEISRRFGLEIDPEKKVYDMSVSEKQTVEIIKVLYRGARILILDEPTAVLTPQEIEKLFIILRKMRDEGCAIIIITHKLNEVMAISDRVTILRKGKSVGTVNTNETSAKELTELMVGKAVELSIDRPITVKEENLLNVFRLFVAGADGRNAVKDMSFDLRGGEVLGVAGIAGSGQKELCEAIAGLANVTGGTILFKNESIVGKSPAEIIKSGISMSFIPEDRLGMGLVASMDITHNMLLKSYKDGSRILLNRKPAKELALSLIDRLEISTPGVTTPVRQLSGGNVQKVLLGREIESKPSLLITAYPVRGLDINSSYTIYDLINEQKVKGVAVLFIGEDLDVLIELCDRILVICHGEVMGIVNANETTKEELGLMMAGERRMEAECKND